MFKNAKFSLLILACFCLIPWNRAAADTNVSSGSITNPIWTPEESPYLITGTLEVAKGATLKINAGTEVRFSPGAKLLVNGELDILGTAADPVMLTLNSLSSATSTSGLWGGIEFGTNAVSADFSNGNYINGSIIKNAIIKFSEGVKCNDASPYITASQFVNNSVGLYITGTSSSVGGLILGSAATSNNDSRVTPMYVSGNTFSDNGIGIAVNRNNGQDYVITPVGYSYIGNKVITAYIDKNTISGSSIGIQAANGDNVIITDNTIRYNSGTAIFLAAGRGHVVQNNDLNNNNVGLALSAMETAVIQNNIKNNADTGLQISQTPLLLTANNIFNNKTHNLYNLVYNLPATGNYWGGTTANAIEKSFLTTAIASGTASTTVSYPVKYNPFLKQEAYVDSIIAPILDTFDGTTTVSRVYLSGLKPFGTSVFVNDEDTKADVNSISWSYQTDLDIGSNTFNIYYKDESGNAGASQKIAINRFAAIGSLAVETYAKTTTASQVILKGVKPANSSLLLDGKEIIPANSDTDWTYTLSLSLGKNSWQFNAYDQVSGQTSQPVAVTITRNEDTTANIIAAEKKASLAADSKLITRLTGRLLLQVENKGNIWYVINGQRYLVTQSNALALFRKFSIGISEANLNKIPTKESGVKGDTVLRKRLAGKFLLRVEKSGNISYVDVDGYRHDVSQESLMTLFRSLALGVSNVNIYKIPVGEINIK